MQREAWARWKRGCGPQEMCTPCRKPIPDFEPVVPAPGSMHVGWRDACANGRGGQDRGTYFDAGSRQDGLNGNAGRQEATAGVCKVHKREVEGLLL